MNVSRVSMSHDTHPVAAHHQELRCKEIRHIARDDLVLLLRAQRDANLHQTRTPWGWGPIWRRRADRRRFGGDAAEVGPGKERWR